MTDKPPTFVLRRNKMVSKEYSRGFREALSWVGRHTSMAKLMLQRSSDPETSKRLEEEVRGFQAVEKVLLKVLEGLSVEDE